MRVNHVTRARKKVTCDKCGAAIRKGQPYSWAKGRYTSKKVRCDKTECRFRPSDLTGSDKKARLYAAQESLEDTVGDWNPEDGIDALQEACRDAAEQIREVAQEYRDAADAMGAAGSQMEETADEVESWADEVEGAGDNLSVYDKDDGTLEEWGEEVRSEIQDGIGNCPV